MNKIFEALWWKNTTRLLFLLSGYSEDNEDCIEELDKEKDKKKQKKDNDKTKLDPKGEDEAAPKKKKRWWRKKYPLPWWCIIIAWILSILCILCGAVFCTFYSLEWGKQKSEEWLSSLLLSFFQSAIVVQPIKVGVSSYLMSFLIITSNHRKFD